jgi:putative redox protein
MRAESGEADYIVVIHSGQHAWVADEPESKGGSGEGPDPFELVFSGLAACSIITIKMYAQHKKWDLQDVSVYLHYSVDNERRITHVERKIFVAGNLSDEQRERLLAVAIACPVSKLLSGDINIDSTLASNKDFT